MVLDLEALIGENEVGFKLVWVVLASLSVLSVVIWKCADGGEGGGAAASDEYGGTTCAAACGGACGG